MWSAWVSGSNTMGSLWTQGGGELWSRRFEGNLQYEWGAGNRINFIASDFKMHTNSYFHPTLSQYGTEPYDQGYSQAIYPTVGNGTNGQSDILVASGNSAALQRADFAIQTYALNGLFQLSPSLTLHVDPYYVRVNHGTASVAATSLPESLVGRDLNGDGDLKDIRPVALSVYPVQHRLGGTVRADWNITASNHLELGTWIDHVNGRFAMIAQTIGQDGAPVSKSGEGQILDGNGNPLNFTDQHNLISTQKAWLQDSWDFLPGWNLVAGLAWQHSRLRGSNGAGLFTGAEYSRTANYSRFLPNASLTLQASKSNQFYYNLNSNMRIPAVASLYQGTNSFEKQKQETTLNQEIGWRYSSPAVLVSAALFLDQFHNRQVSYQVVSGVTSYFNAGDVTTRGVEASVNGKLPYNFTYNLSWTHVAAKQKSDYTTGGLVADTAGKQIYNTPKDLISWGIGYDDSHLYGNILGRYTSGYFGDLENYEKIPPYTIFDLAIGYRIDRPANFLHKIVVSVNVNNLFDNKTLSNVYGGSVSANPSSPFYAAPTYNRGQPRAVLANLTFEL